MEYLDKNIIENIVQNNESFEIKIRNRDGILKELKVSKYNFMGVSLYPEMVFSYDEEGIAMFNANIDLALNSTEKSFQLFGFWSDQTTCYFISIQIDTLEEELDNEDTEQDSKIPQNIILKFDDYEVEYSKSNKFSKISGLKYLQIK